MKLTELSGKNTYLQLPKIEKSEITVLWACDYWDGPNSGILLYHENKYWFQVFSESEDPDLRDYYRRFWIIELTAPQLEEEENRHYLFREKVGFHMDGGGINKQALAHLQPEEIQQEYYKAYKDRKPMTLSENRVIGWFET